MKPDGEIDSALRALGSARPPEGMERRIHARLDVAPRRFPVRYSVSAAAIAAGVLIFAAILSPSNRSNSQGEDSPLHSAAARNDQQPTAQNPARDVEQQIMARPRSSFGTASAVHVPDQPIALEPAPVGQRRGHTRSSRTSEGKAGNVFHKANVTTKPASAMSEPTLATDARGSSGSHP